MAGLKKPAIPPKTASRSKAVTVPDNNSLAEAEALATNNNFHLVFILLSDSYGIDFSSYKSNTIHRRIFRRMKLHKISHATDYLSLLKANPAELDLLYQDLLINVTSFFREPDLYKKLSNKIFPAILASRKNDDPIRIWIPACASGEEACSMAICLLEFLERQQMQVPVYIFATDLNETVIKKARLGLYGKNIGKEVPPKLLNKYFIKKNNGYQVIKPVRDTCIYATHNLLTDPPFSKMDLISCQNVMIYLNAPAQQKVLHAFHYALKPPGFLVLGRSESVTNATELFIPSAKGQRIFTRSAQPPTFKFEFNSRRADRMQGKQPGTIMTNALASNENDLDAETDRILLSRFSPASILINKDLQMVRFNGDTARYLQPASGKATLDILKMVKDEIVFELRSLLNKLKKNSEPIKKENIHITLSNVLCEISIELIPVKAAAGFCLIVFHQKAILPTPIATKTTVAGNLQNKISRLEAQLTESKEHVTLVAEEFNTVQEQLQTANEEILSSNEELQSINEELETSKEELQSTNEELITINEELQRRNAELSNAVNYAQAIIETIKEPLLVLDTDMRVEKVNKAFSTLFAVKHDLVLQNNFYELGHGQLNIKPLREKLRKIISTSKSFEDFELEIPFPGGLTKVLCFNAMRINHPQKINNRYLLVIEDITAKKEAEKLLRSNEERLRLIIQNAFDIVTIFSEKGDIVYESDSVKDFLGYSAAERVGKNIFTDSLVHPEDAEIKKHMFRESLKHPGKNIRSEFRLRHKDNSYRTLEAICVNMLDDFRIKGVVANYHDVTERRVLENQKDQFIGIASHELKTPVTTIKGYAQLLEQIVSEKEDNLAHEMIRKMNNQVNRLGNLIQDLLDVTQLEEGLLKFKKDHFDINQLISEVIDEMQPTAINHIITAALEKPVMLTGDKEKIRQEIGRAHV